MSEELSGFVPPWERETLGRRLRRRLRGARQWIVMAVLWGIALFLWERVHQLSRFPAQARTRSHRITAPLEGKIMRVWVKRGQRIQRGQRLLQLDVRQQALELNMARLERKRLEEQMVSVALKLRLSQAAMLARLQASLMAADAAFWSGHLRLDAARAELGALTKELTWQEQLRKQQLGRSNNLGTLRARQHALQVWVKIMPRLVHLYRRQRMRLQHLRRVLKPYKESELKGMIARQLRPLQQQWAIQSLRVKKLALMLKRATLRAPVSGVVAEIFERVGANCRVGTALMRITQENRGEVVAYIAQAHARRIKRGMDARVRVRHPSPDDAKRWLFGAKHHCAVVVGIGPLGPIPMRFRHVPRKPLWVRPVFLKLKTPYRLLPGERIDVDFSPDGCKE